VEGAAEVRELGQVGLGDRHGRAAGPGHGQCHAGQDVDRDGAQHGLRHAVAGGGEAVAAQDDDRPVAHRPHHLRGQLPGPDEDGPGVHGHAARGEVRARDVVGAQDRPEGVAGEVGGDDGEGMGVHDRPDLGPAPEDLGVQGSSAGRR
jgi:hypothetical protein